MVAGATLRRAATPVRYSPSASDMAAAWIAKGVRRPSFVRTMVVRVLRRVKSQ
jgi:hypothetical protein